MRIKGLKQAFDLNGQEAIVEQWDERRGRWKLRLATGELRAVLGGNLELVDEAKEQAVLSTFGCEVLGTLGSNFGECPYNLWPLIYSGFIRVRLSDKLLSRLNAQLDELYDDTRSPSHAPFLQGEMKEGRQLTVHRPDEEYVETLLACAEKLAISVLAEDALDHQFVLDSVWSVHQVAGDYNPVHFHSNARSNFGFSSFLHLQLPTQLTPCQLQTPSTGAHGHHDGVTSFIWKTDGGLGRASLECPGILECEIAEGYLYVFPQWVQHHVWPFRGPGERRTLAANVAIVPAPPTRRLPGPA